MCPVELIMRNFPGEGARIETDGVQQLSAIIADDGWFTAESVTVVVNQRLAASWEVLLLAETSPLCSRGFGGLIASCRIS